MRNRAKCKLCKDILESFHHHDYVTCKCGEISIDGGQNYFKCSAKNFDNFLRVDDEGHEIVVTVQENERVIEELPKAVDTKQELIKVVEEMIQNVERLPTHAQMSPLTHYDYQAILLLFLRILKGI